MGVLTVLTVLLVLTLAVFSALTYTSARADWALSRINADTVAAYYAADAEAARLLSGFSTGSEEELEATLPMTGGPVPAHPPGPPGGRHRGRSGLADRPGPGETPCGGGPSAGL